MIAFFSTIWSVVSGLLGLKSVISEWIRHKQAVQQGATLQANADLQREVTDDHKQIDALKQDAALVDRLNTDDAFAERLRTGLNKRSGD